MSKNHFLPFQIITIIFLGDFIFLQNGCLWPFWMSKTHFRWHFWPFQINTNYFFQDIFTKWPPAPILDVRNSLLNAFLAISNRYATLTFFLIIDKVTAVDHISGHFRPMRIFFPILLHYKMATSAHFGCPKFIFDGISVHFRSIRNFNFVGKFLTKWLPSAILDVQNSLSIAFLSILDQYAT